MPEERVLDEKWSASVRDLLVRYYPDYSPHRFSELLSQYIHSSSCVLEIGAGSGRHNQSRFNLRGKVARYVGVDPDANVLKNPFLDESYQAGAEALPFPDDTFDLVFHHYVAEHFPLPLACNLEIARVLKPGGHLLFQTPSRFYYASLFARMTPQWFHEFYVGRFGSGRTSQEVFPTFYRLNDKRVITKQLESCGFRCDIQQHSLPPGYLRFSKASFLAGVLYERTLERWIPALRATIVVIARKQQATRQIATHF